MNPCQGSTESIEDRTLILLELEQRCVWVSANQDQNSCSGEEGLRCAKDREITIGRYHLASQRRGRPHGVHRGSAADVPAGLFRMCSSAWVRLISRAAWCLPRMQENSL